MNTTINKTTEHKSQSRINSSPQKKSSSENTFQFADNRPEAIAQQKLQRMADNSTQAKLTTQLKTISSSGQVVQRQITVAHQNHVEDDNRASYAEAQVHGNTLPLGANSPSVDPTGWDELSEKFEMGDIYRMHLWNGRLGGPGNRTWNLTPGPSDINTDMAQEEVNAQAEVNNGNIVSLWTQTTYGHSIDDQDPEYYFPSNIDFNWSSQTMNGIDVDDGNWSSNVPLPDQLDLDYDPYHPDDLGNDDESLAW